MIVGVGRIELDLGELGVVLERDALIAEIATDLVDPLKTAGDEPFQVQLVRDAQVQLLLELVVEGRKRPGCCAPVDRLQHRGFNLDESLPVQETADGRHDPGPGPKDIAHFGVDRQIDVALAVALFLVREGVEYLPILLLDHGQRAQGLGQEPQPLGTDAGFPGASEEHGSCGFDKVTQVQVLPEHGIDILTQEIAAQVQLDAAATVLDVGEGGLAHHADAHQPPDDCHLDRSGILRGPFEGGNRLRCGVGAVGSRRVGINTRFAQPFQLEPALLFLVGQILFRHGSLLS